MFLGCVLAQLDATYYWYEGCLIWVVDAVSMVVGTIRDDSGGTFNAKSRSDEDNCPTVETISKLRTRNFCEEPEEKAY